MIGAYRDFDLLILAAQGCYQARVINSPVGQAAVEFGLPFNPYELQHFFWLTGRVLRGLRFVQPPSPAAEPLDSQRFGTRLFEAAFAADVGVCLRRSLDEAERQGMGLRIRLRLDDAPELADLPWEYLYDPTLGRFLALSGKTPVVRYLELPQQERDLRVTPPLRVFAIVSDPEAVQPLAVEKEWMQLHDALDGLQSRKLVVLERLPQATLAGLQRRLRQGEVHVLHFIGHGAFDPGQNVGGLYFEDEAGGPLLVTAERLGTLLHDQAPLRLVFLNACEGARGGQQDAFAGTAQTLVRQGIPAVLAMQFPVSDAAALALAQAFYAAVADGAAVDTAVSEARKSIYAAGDELEWGTPVFFTRSPHGRLFASAQEKHDGSEVDTAEATLSPKGGVQINIATGGGTITSSQISVGNIAGGDIRE